MATWHAKKKCFLPETSKRKFHMLVSESENSYCLLNGRTSRPNSKIVWAKTEYYN
jgi:hypothetical protein